jgi:predicted MPP superfamily phosphohydrolase
MYVFLGVLLALVALLHVYAWHRLLHAPEWPRAVRRVGVVALIALAVMVPIGVSAPRWAGPEAGRVLVLVGCTWVGVLFLLFSTLVVLDVGRGGARLVRRGPPGVDLERRRFLARAVAGVAGAGTASLSAVAFAEAARPPEVVRLRVPIARLPEAFEGLRVVQWSDVHVGPLLGRGFVDDLVARTNALAPDVVAITGDLVDGDVPTLADAVAPLAALRARHGVFFSTGNHEYYSGVDPWLAHLRGLGVRVLRNERVEIERGGARLAVAGVDDAGASRWPGHGPDADRALAGRDPQVPVVFLAHQPKQMHEARRLGADLVLSGHTHGGQIFPFGLFVRLTQPAVAGLHRFGDTWLYVNRGTGFWGPPMRLANPAEITVFELVRAPS